MEFISVEIKSECEKCGRPVMLNGPVLALLCSSCHHERAIHPMTWKSILGDALNDSKELKKGEGYHSSVIAGEYKREITVTKETPCCSSCGSPVKKIPDKISGAQVVECQKCKNETIVSSPPEWLTKVVPEITCIVNGQTMEANGKKEKPSCKPILFTCPSCSGNLSVDGTSRVVTCRYCTSDIYLPDDLWLRMHPVSTVEKWYIGFMKNSTSVKQKKLNSDLLEAAYDGDDDTGIELLNKGAFPDSADSDNRTVLFLAAATDAGRLG